MSGRSRKCVGKRLCGNILSSGVIKGRSDNLFVEIVTTLSSVVDLIGVHLCSKAVGTWPAYENI